MIFSLEWAKNNQIVHRDIHVEVPWLSKRLSLSINKTAETWRLQLLDKQQQAFSSPAMSKIVLYFTEMAEGDILPKSLNLDALYWQSRSSMMRLNNNGSRYPHYFNSQSKHFPSHISDIVELPQIRYSSNNNELLSGRSGFSLPRLKLNQVL